MTVSFACEIARNKLENASRNREILVSQIKLLLRIAEREQAWMIPFESGRP